MIDFEVKAIVDIIRAELERQGNDGCDGIYYRKEDGMVDGRLDVTSIATLIVEHMKVH